MSFISLQEKQLKNSRERAIHHVLLVSIMNDMIDQAFSELQPIASKLSININGLLEEANKDFKSGDYASFLSHADLFDTTEVMAQMFN